MVVFRPWTSSESVFLPALLALIFAAAPAWRETQNPQTQNPEAQHTVIGASGTADSSVAAVRKAVEDGLVRLRPSFPGVPSRPFRIVVHQTIATLPREVRDWLHSGAPGVALLGKDEIHLILAETAPAGASTLQSVVEHELIHILLHQFAGSGGEYIPRWIHEGMAQDLSDATYLGAREEDLIAPARFGNLPTFAGLTENFRRGGFRLRQAYAHSFSLVAFLRRELGHQALLEIAKATAEQRDFTAAFVGKTQHAVVYYEEKWIEYLENDSGAPARVILQNCFSYLIILAAPVLALAVIRRLARDKRAREKLLAAEAAEDQESPLG